MVAPWLLATWLSSLVFPGLRSDTDGQMSVSVYWLSGSVLWSSLASGVTQMGLMSTGGQISVSGPWQIVKKKGFEILIYLPNHLFIQFY